MGNSRIDQITEKPFRFTPVRFPPLTVLRPVHGGGRAPAVAPPLLDGAVQAIRRRLLRLPRRWGPPPAPGLPPGTPLQTLPDPPPRQTRAPPLAGRCRSCRCSAAPRWRLHPLAPPLSRPRRFVVSHSRVPARWFLWGWVEAVRSVFLLLR